jgi:hypothetical protein
MDMAIDDAIAVRERKSCLNRSQVSFNSFGKFDEFSNSAVAYLF